MPNSDVLGATPAVPNRRRDYRGEPKQEHVVYIRVAGQYSLSGRVGWMKKQKRSLIIGLELLDLRDLYRQELANYIDVLTSN
jgi:hypothetical protein